MRAVIMILAMATVTSCNRSPSIDAHNASVADVAKQMKAAGGSDTFVNPGKWESTVAIDSMDAPGMPPQAAQTMKSMSARAHVVQSCLTPEDAKKPKPEMFSGDSDRCRYDHFTMSGGKIDMVMRCAGGHGMGTGQTMHMTGTYAPDRYHMDMINTTETGVGGVGPMTMKMHLDAKRLGPCDADK
jgi:hypothetical protein